MSFWEKTKKFFGIEDDEKEKKPIDTESYKEGEDKLMEELGNMSSDFIKKENEKEKPIGDILPEDPGYDYLEYHGDSDGEINEKVNDYFNEAKYNDFGKIEQGALDKINKSSSKKNQATQNAEKAIANLQKELDEMQKNAVSSAVKKGLTRSSISSEMTKNIDENYENKSDEVKTSLDDNLKKVDSEIESLKKEKEQAIKDLDLSYADKISGEIGKLKEKRNKDKKEIEKYNNALKEKEIAYKEDREKAIKKQIVDHFNDQIKREKEEQLNGYVGEKKENYDKRLQLAREYYKNLPPEVAKEMVRKNTKLEGYLGHNYGKFISHLGE